MENAKKNHDAEDNSLAHYINDKEGKEPATYDPDSQMPVTTIGTGQGYRDVPLEESDPDKGYGTNNGGQGKWDSTLPLADEDMDRRQSDEKKNEDLQESYEMMQKNKNKEEDKE